jgi:uncharacterized membrane protein
VKRLISLGNKILESIPLINKLYKALTQISEAFFSGQQNALKKPVLIEFPKKGVYSIAFITREVEGVIERVLPEEVVSVFLPTTPNPTTGYLLFVPKKDIHDVNLTIEDAVKLIISGGTVSLEEKTANSEKERV